MKPTQKPTSISSSSTVAATVEQDETVVSEDGGAHGKDGNGDVVVFENDSSTIQEEHDAKMSQTTDLKDLLLKLGKSNQIGLIVFGGVILVALILVVIIIRSDTN